MQFQYPLFLISLLTLVIPVIIHLFNFRRYRRVQFSNVQFLRQVIRQQAPRRHLKERLVLASRLLALFFLVVAFARPYLPGRQTVPSGREQFVSIFVDNSYSMQALNSEGALLDEAKRRAKEIVAAYGVNDRFQLLTQEFDGREQRFVDKEEFNDAVEAVTYSARSRTLPEIMQKQENLLSEHPGDIQWAYILSDFQKNMAAERSLRKDAGIRFRLLQLEPAAPANVAVDSVWLLAAVHRPMQTEKLVVRLRNYGREKAEKVPLRLMLNGVQKAFGAFSIPAGGSRTDTLSVSGLSPGWQRGEVRIEDNPVSFDNQFFFSFEVRDHQPVLLINSGKVNPFVTTAFGTDRFFQVKNVSQGNIDYSTLRNYPLIVVCDLPDVSRGLAQQLKEAVSAGATMLVFPGDHPDQAGYKDFLGPMGAAWPQDLVRGRRKVSSLDLHNPVFQTMFDSFPGNPDLPQVTSYFRLLSPQGGESLMELPGGDPLLASYQSGNGHVYVSAVALSDSFSNLQRHALFVPLLFRIALVSGHEQPAAFVTGDNEVIPATSFSPRGKELFKLSGRGMTIIPDIRRSGSETRFFLSDELQQPGHYQLSVRDSVFAVFSFNTARSESDLSYLTERQLSELMPGALSMLRPGARSLSAQVGQLNLGVQLWKLCIILALLFLAVETLVISFYRVDRRLTADSD